MIDCKSYFADGKTPATDRRKHKCRSLVKSAIDKGLLPKLDGNIKCIDCEKPAKCYDHRNYTYPLLVSPVCMRCNSLRGLGMVPADWGYSQCTRDKSKDINLKQKTAFEKEPLPSPVELMKAGVLFSTGLKTIGMTHTIARNYIFNYVARKLLDGVAKKDIASSLGISVYGLKRWESNIKLIKLGIKRHRVG